MSEAAHPPLEPALTIICLLQSRSWPVAVGGSAVLGWLGLTERVRDWDVTVTAEPSEVLEALTEQGFSVRSHENRDHPFASRAWLTVAADGHELDVLVGFALRDGDRTVDIPVRVAGYWHGLPVANPADWEHAYRLMGRHGRADALREFRAKSDWIDR